MRARLHGFYKRYPSGEHLTHHLLAQLICMLGNMFKSKNSKPMELTDAAPWLDTWLNYNKPKKDLKQAIAERSLMVIDIVKRHQKDK